MKTTIISYDTFNAIANLRTVVCALCGHKHFDYGTTWTNVQFPTGNDQPAGFNPRIKFSKSEKLKIGNTTKRVCADRRKCIARQNLKP